MTGTPTPVRIAVVGAGAIVQLAHLPSLVKMRGVELVAIVDNDAAKARALAGRFGATATAPSPGVSTNARYDSTNRV